MQYSYKNGFYVHAPSVDLNSPEAVANYITRYIGRPAMAQSRITDYNGQNVPFCTSVAA
ncbi:transposase [Phascolarctobacterium sp.]